MWQNIHQEGLNLAVPMAWVSEGSPYPGLVTGPPVPWQLPCSETKSLTLKNHMEIIKIQGSAECQSTNVIADSWTISVAHFAAAWTCEVHHAL